MVECVDMVHVLDVVEAGEGVGLLKVEIVAPDSNIVHAGE